MLLNVELVVLLMSHCLVNCVLFNLLCSLLFPLLTVKWIFIVDLDWSKSYNDEKIFSFQYVVVFEGFSFVTSETVAEVNWRNLLVNWQSHTFFVVNINTMSYLFIFQFIWLSFRNFSLLSHLLRKLNIMYQN